MAKTQRFALVSAIIIIVAAGTMALSYVLISAAKKAPSIRSPIAAAPTVQKRRAAAIKCAQ